MTLGNEAHTVDSALHGKLIVFAAPSGTGKSTIAKHVLETVPNLSFSVSATTRPRRNGEEHGREYFFLSKAEFEQKIQHGDFIEYELFFDNYYGTLKGATDEILRCGKHLLLDLDVKGALNVKRLYDGRALLLFIKPPSFEILRERLMNRKSETAEAIQKRLERASYELSFAERFDKVVVNDDLERACSEVISIINQFINAA